jgi:hypothetical protein
VEGVHPAIRLNEVWTQKKDQSKEVRLALRAAPECQQGRKERHRTQREFVKG